MEIYLIRHGLAADRGGDYPDDSKRPLTRRGFARLNREAEALVALDIGFDQILTSPLLRGRQTADLLAERLQSRPHVAATQALAPGTSASAAIDELSKYSRKARLAIVGHEPGMGELAAQLIGARRPLEFKKGAICRIDVDTLPPARSGWLRWFVTPKMLRSIAKGS